MATKIFCDICSKEVEADKASIVHLTRSTTNVSVNVWSLDLCTVCLRELANKNWGELNFRKKKIEEQGT